MGNTVFMVVSAVMSEAQQFKVIDCLLLLFHLYFNDDDF